MSNSNNFQTIGFLRDRETTAENPVFNRLDLSETDIKEILKQKGYLKAFQLIDDFFKYPSIAPDLKAQTVGKHLNDIRQMFFE